MIALLLALSLASADSVQAARLDEAKSRLEQLRSDSRRKKLREGWESILRELDAAARAAPKGARAAEVALTAARVRVELFGASKSAADARAASSASRRAAAVTRTQSGVRGRRPAVRQPERSRRIVIDLARGGERSPRIG